MMRTTNILSIAIMLAIICLAAIKYGTHDFRLVKLVTNADAMYLPLIFENTIRKGGDFSSWHMPPAPYFFPDYLIYMMGYLITENIYYQIAIFSIVQILILYMAIKFLFASVRMKDSSLLSSMVVATLVFFGFTSRYYLYIFTSAHHFGIFLSAILCCALVIRLIDQRAEARLWYILLLVISAASTFSDALFVVQFTVPAICALLLIALTDTTKKHCVLVINLILATSAALGIIAYFYLLPAHRAHSIDIGISNSNSDFNEAQRISLDIATSNPEIALFFILYVGIVIFGMLHLLSRPRQMSLSQTCIILTFSCSFGIVAALFLLDSHNLGDRFIIPTLTWPIIMSVAFISSFEHIKRALGVIVTSALTLLAVIEYSSSDYFGDYYPVDIACFDQAVEDLRLEHGIAQYWDAKKMQALSKSDITLAQYTVLGGELRKGRWITSDIYYNTSYDFFVDRRDQDYFLKLIQSFDRSSEITGSVRCGDINIIAFKSSYWDVDSFFRPEVKHSWQGCSLPSQTGVELEDCHLGRSDLALDGFLSFGPYVDIEPGTYRFTLEYSSMERSGSMIGEWDVGFLDGEGYTQLGSGAILGSNGREASIEGVFSLPEHHLRPRVEVRTRALDDFDLSIHSLEIFGLDVVSY